MNLPTRLIEARKRKGRSQAYVAKALDVSTGTVAGWESETKGHRFRLSKLEAVAAAYGVRPKVLLAWWLESAA